MAPISTTNHPSNVTTEATRGPIDEPLKGRGRGPTDTTPVRGRGRPTKTESQRLADQAIRKSVKEEEEKLPMSALLAEVAEDPDKDPEIVLEDWEKELLRNYVYNGGKRGKAAKAVGLGSFSTSLARLLKSSAGRVYTHRMLEQKKADVELTQVEVVNKARKTYDKAMEAGAFKEAMLAVDFLGKYLGMQVDRTEHVERKVFTSEDVQKDTQSYQKILSKVITTQSMAEQVLSGAKPMLVQKATQRLIESKPIEAVVDFTEVPKMSATDLKIQSEIEKYKTGNED